MFKNCPFICKKQLLRNEIHSSLLVTNYDANAQSSFGIKTPLIFFFPGWIKWGSRPEILTWRQKSGLPWLECSIYQAGGSPCPQAGKGEVNGATNNTTELNASRKSSRVAFLFGYQSLKYSPGILNF